MIDKIDAKYRLRGWKVRLPIVLVSLVTGAVTFYGFFAQDRFNWPWAAAFAIVCIAGLILERKLSHTYRCPNCNQALGSPRLVENRGTKEYVYDCTTCAIIWHTKTYQSD
jgi:hypothetical protein